MKRGALLLILIFLFIYFLTGFPFVYINPHWVRVKVLEGNLLPVSSPLSTSTITLSLPSFLKWGTERGIDEGVLLAAFKAAAIERDLNTGFPAEDGATGARIDPFILLAIIDKETSLMKNDEINPEEPNVTGHCLAWQELMKHPLLGRGEVDALSKIVQPLQYSPWKVYGSCGGGCIGWAQALPSNWLRFMSSGTANPWKKEDAVEFIARYLGAHGYFTRGVRDAVKAYNPNAPDYVYTDPVLLLAEELRQSFTDGTPERKEEEITLVKTPVLELALLTGELLEVLKKNELGPRTQKFSALLRTIQGPLSRLAMGGQPRVVNYKDLNWLILSQSK